MQFRDHIYHLTPEGGEQLLQEMHERIDQLKGKLVDITKQKNKAMKRYDDALKETRDEINGCMNVIKMVEDTVFGGEYGDLSSNEEIKQILNDPSIPF